MTSYTVEGRPIVLSAEAERRNLAQYGTKVFPEITALNILQSAEKDVRYAEVNKVRRRDKERTLPYSFPASIANSAKSAQEILTAVLEKKPPPRTVGEQRLWGDRDKVREALALTYTTS